MNVAGLLQILASAAWLAVVGFIAIIILRTSRNRPIKGLITGLVVTVVSALLLTTLGASIVFVQPEQRGVVISAIAPLGYRENAITPGLRWITPYLENVVYYPISRQTYTMSIAPLEGQLPGDDSVAARTSDGQEVLVDASVIYAVDPAHVIDVHIQWQNRYSIDLVRPLARGVIRDAISQYGVEEVYSSKRAEVVERIREEMTAKLSDNGLLMREFILRNITFSPEYAASVEQKQIAEQLAQQAVFVVEQRRQEAEQARQVAQGQADASVIRAQGDANARIIQAEAEAQALELLAIALRSNPDLLTYQYINQIAPGIQVMLVPNDNPYLLPLPTLEPAPGSTVLPTQTVPEPQPTPAPEQP